MIIIQDDLKPCLEVFLQSSGKVRRSKCNELAHEFTSDHPNLQGTKGKHSPIIHDCGELVDLALKCVYASKR